MPIDKPVQSKARLFPKAKHEWYQEEPIATEVLLKNERFVGGVYDCACGGGNIVKTCLSNGIEAVGSDIIKRQHMPEDAFIGHLDFLQAQDIPMPNIITNPPFYRAKGTEMFIRKALSFEKLNKLAIYAELTFLASEKRALNLFAELPPSRVWIILPRPSAPPGEFLLEGGEAKGGKKDAAWFIWDRTCPSSGTTIHWAVHSQRKGAKSLFKEQSLI